jgi:O-antigen ligase
VPFGAFLAFAALLTIFGPVQRVPGWVRWPALALMLVALTESFSRVGWVFFIVGLIVLAWPQQKRLVVAFALALVVVMLASPDVRERALPVGSEAPTAASSEAGYESYGWRLENWGGLLDKWAQKPVLGYGLESTQYVNPRAPVGLSTASGGGYEAHNMVVRVLVEGGVLLLIVYLAFFAVMIRRLWRLARADWELREGARVLLVIWCLMLFTGATTDDPFSLTALMVGVLALTGAVEGVWALRRSAVPEDPRRPEEAPARSGEPGTFWRPAAPGSGAG